MAKKFNIAELLPESERVSESDPSQIVDIPLHKIVANGRNFYGVRDVEALADSIKLNGLLDPLVVYPLPGGTYRLISGHRRWSALHILNAETAPCRIIERPRSDAQETLMLIHANSTGRVLTPYEQVEQAKLMTDALVALKKEGAELPGRLRDIVADAMGISPSALARKQVITRQLTVPGFRSAYEAGKLSEEAAYQIARLPEEQQYDMLDRVIDAGKNYETVDIKTVNRLRKIIESGESTTQDLCVQAEKLGLIGFNPASPEPLWRILLRQTGVTMPSLQVIGSRADGIEALRKANMNTGGAGGSVVHTVWDAGSGGVRITSPVCCTLRWDQVWDILVLDLAEGKAPEAAKPRATEGGGPYEETGGWRGWYRVEGPDVPPDGMRCIVWDPTMPYMPDVCIYRDGAFWNRYEDAEEYEAGCWWAPWPEMPDDMRDVLEEDEEE